MDRNELESTAEKIQDMCQNGASQSDLIHELEQFAQRIRAAALREAADVCSEYIHAEYAVKELRKMAEGNP